MIPPKWPATTMARRTWTRLEDVGTIDAAKVKQRTRWWASYAKEIPFLDVSDKAKAHFIATLEVRCSPCGTRLAVGRYLN